MSKIIDKKFTVFQYKGSTAAITSLPGHAEIDYIWRVDSTGQGFQAWQNSSLFNAFDTLTAYEHYILASKSSSPNYVLYYEPSSSSSSSVASGSSSSSACLVNAEARLRVWDCAEHYNINSLLLPGYTGYLQGKDQNNQTVLGVLVQSTTDGSMTPIGSVPEGSYDWTMYVFNPLGSSLFQIDIAQTAVCESTLKLRFYAFINAVCTAASSSSSSASENSSASESSSSSSSSPTGATLYFNGAVNSDWNNLGNWWSDSSFTTPATALPGSNDTVYIISSVNSNGSSDPSVSLLSVSGQSNLGIAVNVSQFAFFTGSGTLSSSGIIKGNAIFTDQSFNYGTVIGQVIFSQFASHFGAVFGNATFNEGSMITGNIFSVGSVQGDAIFNSYSSNFGVVSGNATFNGTSTNNSDKFSTGVVGGNATFNDASNNFGIVEGQITCNTTGICLLSSSSSSSKNQSSSSSCPALVIPTNCSCGVSYKLNSERCPYAECVICASSSTSGSSTSGSSSSEQYSEYPIPYDVSLTTTSSQVEVAFGCCETYQGTYTANSFDLLYGTYVNDQVDEGSANVTSVSFNEEEEIQTGSVSLSELESNTKYWFKVRTVTDAGPSPAIPQNNPPFIITGSSSSSSSKTCPSIIPPYCECGYSTSTDSDGCPVISCVDCSSSSTSGSSASSELPWCDGELIPPGVNCKCTGNQGFYGSCSEVVPIEFLPKKLWPINQLYPGGPPADPAKWDSKGYSTCAYRDLIFGYVGCSCCFDVVTYATDIRGCPYITCKQQTDTSGKHPCQDEDISCVVFDQNYEPSTVMYGGPGKIDLKGNGWDADGNRYEWDGTSYVKMPNYGFTPKSGSVKGGWRQANCSELHQEQTWDDCPIYSSSSSVFSSSSSSSGSSSGSSSSGSSSSGSFICDPACSPSECCVKIVPGLNVCTPCGGLECPCPSSSSRTSGSNNSSSSSSSYGSSSSSPCPCADVYLTCTSQCGGNCPKVTMLPCQCGPGVEELICDCDTKPCPYGGWSRSP